MIYSSVYKMVGNLVFENKKEPFHIIVDDEGQWTEI